MDWWSIRIFYDIIRPLLLSTVYFFEEDEGKDVVKLTKREDLATKENDHGTGFAVPAQLKMLWYDNEVDLTKTK